MEKMGKYEYIEDIYLGFECMLLYVIAFSLNQTYTWLKVLNECSHLIEIGWA